MRKLVALVVVLWMWTAPAWAVGSSGDVVGGNGAVYTYYVERVEKVGVEYFVTVEVARPSNSFGQFTIGGFYVA